jgi:GT2 family glycosyltransferase
VSEPRLTVVIPSHHRPASLGRLLDALERQSTDEAFEVVVVLDGDDGSSARLLRDWAAADPTRRRWTSQPRRGQAVARNTGAAMARAPVVLFLDDDMEPEGDVVEVHLRHHGDGRRIVVLGEGRVVLPPARRFLEQMIWAWWEDRYQRRAEPGRVDCYTDLCAGHLSMRTDDFLGVGGFNPRFVGYGSEDYELGYRLLEAGVAFVVEPAARARHHHRAEWKTFLWARQQEGRADVVMGELQPELRAGLRLIAAPPPGLIGAYRIGLIMPWAVEAITPPAVFLLNVLEWLGLRSHWRKGLDVMVAMRYWRGVAEELGAAGPLRTRRALTAYRKGATRPPEIDIDITRLTDDGPVPLWMNGPNVIRVEADGLPVGVVEARGPVEDPVVPYVVGLVIDQLAAPLTVALGMAGGISRPNGVAGPDTGPNGGPPQTS